MRKRHKLFVFLFLEFLIFAFLTCSNQSGEETEVAKKATSDLMPAKIVYYAIPG